MYGKGQLDVKEGEIVALFEVLVAGEVTVSLLTIQFVIGVNSAEIQYGSQPYKGGS